MNPPLEALYCYTATNGDDSRPLPILSVVIPAYNESQNIPLLYQHLAEVMPGMVAEQWELIIVDDGSRDATWRAIHNLAQKDGRIKGVRLSRNFGHQYALMAGMEVAQGEAIITMDCDLQHPVEILPILFEKWRAGYKVVKTLRQESLDVGLFKGWTSRTFYRFFSFLSGMELQPGEADFRLMDRQALDELLRFNEQGLFLRGLTEWIGFSSCAIPYNPGVRTYGQTQYTLKKMASLAWKGLSSFSIMPLRIGICIGLLGSLISLCTVFYAFFGKIIGEGAVPGWASTMMVISVLFFLLFIYLGILGEYIGRIIIEVRGRPRYIVSETRGIDRRRSNRYE
jgi:dolichol-phosphate mannosyltransferase